VFQRVCFVVSILIASTSAFAYPLNPGETIHPGETSDGVDPLTDLMPAPGTVIAHEVRSVTALYADPNHFADGPLTRDGTFEEWVVRLGSGKLSFAYSFDFPNGPNENSPGSQGASLTVNGFHGFSTDVTGTSDLAFPLGVATTFTRSSDGASIKLDSPDEGGPGFARVDTNATVFGRNGTLTELLDDDFATPNDPDRGFHTFAGTVNVSNAFAPAESTTAVPLPPAAYTALGTIGLIVVSKLSRRARLQ
jgi:hypothetical protein